MQADDETATLPEPRVTASRRASRTMGLVPPLQPAVEEEAHTAESLAGLLLTHSDKPLQGVFAWQLARCAHVVSWDQPEALWNGPGVRALIELILAQNLSVRGESLHALWNATADEEGAAAVIKEGGVVNLGRALVAADLEREACIGGMSVGQTLRQAAVAVARNISVNESTAQALFDAGVRQRGFIPQTTVGH